MGDKILYLHGVPAIGGAEQDLLTIINGLDRKQMTPLGIGMRGLKRVHFNKTMRVFQEECLLVCLAIS